jgi:hypothetical protein
MTTEQEWRKFAGTLSQGSLRNISCTVLALENRLKGTDAVAYTGITVTEEPINLPDGYYDLHFEGQSVQMHRVNGKWI